MNHNISDLNTQRVERSATIQIHSPVDNVFPLFGPVREKDWAHGWDPLILFPKDSLVAKHMVFRTQGGLHGSKETYTWTIVNYEPQKYFIEYLVSASERLWFISISCTPDNNTTSATITYSYTGFTAAAIGKNKRSIEEMFASNLKDWEQALNDYLQSQPETQRKSIHNP